MKNDLRTPRLGLAVALCVALTAVWLVALYGTYEESRREKYDVCVSPGVVTYGTHSTAIIPMVTMPTHHSSIPMISGGAVRSYAYSGHATATSTTGSGFKMHTTSSATVHTIGSGGGGFNSPSPATNHQSASSSRGVYSSSISMSMPILALATPTYTAQSEMSAMSASAAAPGRNGRVRKAYPGDGDYPGQPSPDGNQWWDGWDWVDYAEGDTKTEGGKDWVYHDGAWEEVGNQSQPTSPDPVGDAPWLLIFLLAGAYGLVKTMQKKQNAI